MMKREDELAEDLMENGVYPDPTKEWLRRFRERLVERIWPILDHPEFDLSASYR